MSRTQADKLMRHIRSLVAAENPQVADQEFLRRFVLTGDEQAFEALVLRHGPMVLRVCRGILKDTHAAEDAFQATFLLLFRKAAAIRKLKSIGSWLYKVAYHVAVRARAAARQRIRRDAQLADRASAPSQDGVTLGELQSVLHEELQRLPERFRASLVLCCLQGKTRDEAAQVLGWSLGTLKGRLEKGRALLHARLVRRGIALPAAIGATLLSDDILAAAVPRYLFDSTIRACLSVLPNQVAPTSLISAEVQLLVQGTIRAMILTKLKLLVFTLATVGLLTTGAAVLARHMLVAEPKKAQDPVEGAVQGIKADRSTASEGEKSRVDSQGDLLPVGVIARLGTTRFRHMHTIVALAYSLDGKRLVSGSWDATIRLWDASTGRELRRFSCGEEGFSSVALSPDGKIVAGGNMKRSLFLWEATTGKEICHFEGLENTVFGLTFAPDGKTIAGVSGNVVRVWDVASGKELSRWVGPKEDLRPFAFSPDLKTLALGMADCSIHLWDLKSEKEVREIPTGQTQLASLAFSSDGQTLASSGGEGDAALRLWNASTGKEQARLKLTDATKASFSPDGKALATGDRSGTVHVFDLPDGKERWHTTIFSDEAGLSGMAFSPDSKTLAVTGVGKKAIRFLDAGAGHEVKRDFGHQDDILAVAVMPDGKHLVSAGKDGAVLQWNLATGKGTRLFNLPKGITALACAPDGKTLATAGGDETIRLWDRGSGNEIQRCEGHKGAVDTLAFSPDGKTLASGTWVDHTIRLWDVKGSKERLLMKLPMLKGHNNGDAPLVFSLDGKVLYSGSGDRTNACLYFWDTATGKELRHLESQVGLLALSPDGKTLAAAGSDKYVRLLNGTTGEEMGQSDGQASALAFSPDGRVLAYGGVDGEIHLWEIATRRDRGLLAGHQPGGNARGAFAGGVTALAFTPDGKTLISGGGDTTLLLWDIFGVAKNNHRTLPTNRDLEVLWTDLLESDGTKAHQALCGLIAAQAEGARFLKGKLHPAKACDEKRLGRLIADLDNNEFAVRERASQELLGFDETAVPMLKKALAGKPSEEAHRRLAEVVKALEGPVSGEGLRALRALEGLEHIGTPEARQVVKTLSQGTSEASLTREAKATLKRLTPGKE